MRFTQCAIGPRGGGALRSPLAVGHGPRKEMMTTQSGEGANILVVDDTVENLRLLSSMLGARGYEIRPVTSGRLALQAVERDPPDLVLLDINMPEMNGYEVCTRLKERAEHRDIPVIFLTALDAVADKVKAFEVGGIDYITKPFQLEEVQARVNTHVALRRAAKQISESYERLQALEKLRDDLVHMVVHDMRSPLMVMLGHLDLLRQSAEHKLDQEALGDLRIVAGAARALGQMANDLLDVSRLEEQKLPLQLAPHDLVEMAENVRASLGTLERGRSVDLRAQGALVVRCDGALVRRVIENLVMNAVKHTPAGCGLCVSVGANAQRARIEVADEGPGVPVEARQKIFEKFETVAARAQRKYHSAGLGLAFCKLAVEAHGGAIGVEPRAPRGSVFWFELPLENPK